MKESIRVYLASVIISCDTFEQITSALTWIKQMGLPRHYTEQFEIVAKARMERIQKEKTQLSVEGV